jgi:hypothetical protein
MKSAPWPWDVGKGDRLWKLGCFFAFVAVLHCDYRAVRVADRIVEMGLIDKCASLVAISVAGPATTHTLAKLHAESVNIHGGA